MRNTLLLTVSKTLPELIMPLSISIIFLALSILLLKKRPLASRILGLFSAVILTFFSLPFTASVLISSLESRYDSMLPENAPTADAIVMLGGAISPPVDSRPQPELGTSGDRLLTTFRLFRANKAPMVILSGGSLNKVEAAQSDAEMSKTVLVSWGLPPDNIMTEEKSLNTIQNAQFSTMLAKQHNFKKILLVTSALHMPRAMNTFISSGLQVHPIPANRLIASGDKSIKNRLVPNATSLSGSTKALREYLGLAYTRILNK